LYRRRRLDEAAHAGIVDCQFPIVDLYRTYSPPDSQAINSDGRASDCAAKFEIVTDFGNIEEDFFQVTCHRDFFYWVSEFTTGNPETGSATGVVASHQVYAMAEKLGDVQASGIPAMIACGVFVPGCKK